MKKPQIHETVFVAPNATVVGDVRIGAHSSIFFGAVLRTESDEILIGEASNIQDNCVLHVEHGLPLHVGNDTLVGMGAIVLNGAVIGKNCIIGAGALVPQNAVIPDGSLVIGMPAKVRRSVTEEEIAANRASAAMYMEESAEYKEMYEEV